MLLTCYKTYHSFSDATEQGPEMNIVTNIGWMLIALIHATPALALFQPALLTKLYGIKPESGLFTFMHHRAALFLVIVVMCLWAVFRPEVRPMASVCVGISMGTFVVIWWMSGAAPALRTIALYDIVGLAILLVVGWQAFAH
jgi:glucan phosphoethanolaminetransferase (alkaline phosphatase superfamily)